MASTLVQRLLRTASDWVDIQETLLNASLRQVAPLARGRLLDVGCGRKPYQGFFRPHVAEYLGIEHEATFAMTSAGAGSDGPDLTYDGVRLPFADGSFDTVLNIQVLEHTPRPRLLMAEMARVLSPDGVLILGAPFQFRLHEQPHDYYRYSHHGLAHLCDEAGLEITEVHRQGGLWSVLGHKLNSYLAFRVGRLGGLGQAIGKLGHEATTTEKPRYWSLPFVGASMATIALAARVLDPLLPEPDETLNFLIVARPKPAGASPPM